MTQKAARSASSRRRAPEADRASRVGSQPDEGLRHELAKLQQMLRDNKMTDTEAREQVGCSRASSIDRPAGVAADRAASSPSRKELANAEKKDGPPEKKRRAREEGARGEAGDREEAGRREEVEKNQDAARRRSCKRTAQKALDELVKQMNPWSSLQQITARGSRLCTKRQGRAEGAGRHRRPEAGLRSGRSWTQRRKNNWSAQACNDRVEKQADAEAQLAKRADDLIKNMKAGSEGARSQGRQADRPTGSRRRSRLAEEGRLPSNIRDVANELKDQTAPPEKALQQQEKNLEQIEHMLDELDGKKRTWRSACRRKRKKAQEDLAQVEQENAQASKRRMKEAQKIADPQDRPGSAKKIAKEADNSARSSRSRRASWVASRSSAQQRRSRGGRGRREDGEAARRRRRPARGGATRRAEQIEQARQEFQESEDQLRPRTALPRSPTSSRA